MASCIVTTKTTFGGYLEDINILMSFSIISESILMLVCAMMLTIHKFC